VNGILDNIRKELEVSGKLHKVDFKRKWAIAIGFIAKDTPI
jgi:hypothetical protein